MPVNGNSHCKTAYGDEKNFQQDRNIPLNHVVSDHHDDRLVEEVERVDRFVGQFSEIGIPVQMFPGKSDCCYAAGPADHD